MGKLAPAATVVLVLAVSVAYLPEQQRQYILHDALDPALTWASAKCKGLEGILQSAGLPHSLPLEPIRDKLYQATSSLRDLLGLEHHGHGAGPSCRSEEVAACRLSGKVRLMGADLL